MTFRIQLMISHGFQSKLTGSSEPICACARSYVMVDCRRIVVCGHDRQSAKRRQLEVGAGGETSQHKQAHGECRLRVQFGLHLARPLAHAPGGCIPCLPSPGTP